MEYPLCVMVRSVLIARVHDGLPLTASLDEDEVREFKEISISYFLLLL